MCDSEYTYEIIESNNDAQYCAQLIADEFSAHNPITCYDQVTSKQFYDQCSWPLMKDMLPEHLSFLARHRSTGEIVAAVIAGDLYLQHQRKQLLNESNIVSSIAVDDLNDELDDLFISRDFGQELKPNLVLHITVCAVRMQHSGKGIANGIQKALSDYARDKRNFQYILAQVTNPATRHIFVNKMNGKEVTVIDPTAWLWKKNKDDDNLSYPYKNYQGGLIPNVLIKL